MSPNGDIHPKETHHMSIITLLSSLVQQIVSILPIGFLGL
jgi:hypothetical protein